MRMSAAICRHIRAMLNFSDFKKLSRDIRSVATQYWAHTVKLRLGANCPNQILAALKSDKETLSPGWSNNSSRFWNRMLKGEPVTWVQHVEQTEALLPGSASVLLHPLWFLLDCSPGELDKIKTIVFSMPFEFQTCFLKRNDDGSISFKRATKKFIKKQLSSNSLDSIAFFMVLNLIFRSDYNEMLLMKSFMRLSVMSEFGLVAETFYKILAEKYNDPKDRSLRRTDLFFDIPIRIVPYATSNVSGWIFKYNTSIELACELGIIGPDTLSKTKFIHAINHSEMNGLIFGLQSMIEGFSIEEVGQDVRAILVRLEGT